MNGKQNFTVDWNVLIYLPLMLLRADRGGDLGGVLHHPRVRGPGRVRPHPQDHPGGEEEGCQGSSKSLNQEQMTFAAMDNLKRLSAA